MISFENDYLEGAHEKILTKLLETNMVQDSGYGTDNFTKEASRKIIETLDCPQASVRFLVGGTQTNQVMINSLLNSYEGVISAQTGHISTMEAGAIEFSGHKVLTLPAIDGKITARQVDDYISNFYADSHQDHMVYPGMVYITYPTEYGTLYSKKELEELSRVCRKFEIPLYLDGARLGYGLASPESDLTLADIAELCDAFYIGGTKIGALCGEAVVFTKNNEPKHFTTRIKQHGALLAKGRLLGVQFLELFTDDLYLNISEHAVKMAMKLKDGFVQKGYEFYTEPVTNQLFVILPDDKIKELEKEIDFAIWTRYNENSHITRFVTNWATKESSVDRLSELL